MNGYGRGGDTHRCQKDPRIFSRVACSLINGKASSCAQQVSQLHSPSRASSLSSGAEQTEWRWENSWSSKTHKKRNHFLNVCYLTVKNYGPAFSLLNNKEKKKDGMFIDSLCAWCHGACFGGSDVKRGEKNPACHIAAEYKCPAMHCENIIEQYDIKLSAYEDTISY